MKYMTVTNEKCIHEEIKSRLNSGNACYHSVQSLFEPRHLSKNLKAQNTQKTTILPVVLYDCEIWSLTLRKEHRLRVFENRMLRRVLGPKREKVAGGWRGLHNEELCNLYASRNSLGNNIKEDEMGGTCSTHGSYVKCIQYLGWKT
jgi:hypothetical protein